MRRLIPYHRVCGGTGRGVSHFTAAQGLSGDVASSTRARPTAQGATGVARGQKRLNGTSRELLSRTRPARGKVRERLLAWSAEHGSLDRDHEELIGDMMNHQDGDQFGGAIDTTAESARTREQPTAFDEQNPLWLAYQKIVDQIEANRVTFRESERSFFRLRRGDVVDLNKATGPILFGTYIGAKQDSRGRMQHCFLAANGRVLVTPNPLFPYRITDVLVGAETLSQLYPYLNVENYGQGRFTPTYFPEYLTVNLQRQLFDLFESVNKCIFENLKSMFESFLKLAQPSEGQFIPLLNLSRNILKVENPTQIQEAAVFNYVVKYLVGYNYQHAPGSQAPIIYVHSKNDYELISKVNARLNGYFDYLSQPRSQRKHKSLKDAEILKFHKDLERFIEKATFVVQIKRKGRTISKFPSQVVANAETSVFSEDLEDWTPTEKELLHYLTLGLVSNYTNRSRDFRQLHVLILRRTRQYDDNISLSRGEETAIFYDSQVLHNFLVDLGVLEPYSLPQSRDPWVKQFAREQSLGKLARSGAFGDIKYATHAQTLNQLGLRDSMPNRHDFDNLPVYCIDSQSTNLVDDGISVEETGGGDTWLHVHTAHPSAFTAFDGPLDALAQANFDNVYMPDGIHQMLPSWLSKHFSLGKDKPSLTISAKVSHEGDISDIIVRPTTLKQVVHVPPSVIDEALHGPRTSRDTSPKVQIEFGVPIERPTREEKTIPKPKYISSLSSQQFNDFKILERVANKLAEKRPSNMASMFSNTKDSELEVRYPEGVPPGILTTHDLQKHSSALFDSTVKSLGNPFILFKSWKNGMPSTESLPNSLGNHIVSQCMNFAGEAFARWAVERNLSLVFTGSSQAVEDDGLIQAEIERQILRLINKGVSFNEKTGEHAFPPDLSRKIATMYAVRLRSASPLRQSVLGVKEYAKVTSPLRRYYDFLNLLQIDAQLLHELDAKDSTGKKAAPQPYSTINEIINNNEYRLDLQKQLSLSAKKHWMTHALARAFYNESKETFAEVRLPERWTVVLTQAPRGDDRNTRGYWIGRIQELDGLACIIENSNLRQRYNSARKASTTPSFMSRSHGFDQSVLKDVSTEADETALPDASQDPSLTPPFHLKMHASSSDGASESSAQSIAHTMKPTLDSRLPILTTVEEIDETSSALLKRDLKGADGTSPDSTSTIVDAGESTASIPRLSHSLSTTDSEADEATRDKAIRERMIDLQVGQVWNADLRGVDLYFCECYMKLTEKLADSKD